MLCIRRGRDLCARREGGEGTSSRDARELCIAVSTSPTGAAVEADSGRTALISVGPASGFRGPGSSEVTGCCTNVSASPIDATAIKAARGRIGGTSMEPASNIERTLSGMLRIWCPGRRRGLCIGRGRGEGVSSRDAPELPFMVSASPTGGAAGEAASAPAG
jgi:hypothetical protein